MPTYVRVLLCGSSGTVDEAYKQKAPCVRGLLPQVTEGLSSHSHVEFAKEAFSNNPPGGAAATPLYTRGEGKGEDEMPPPPFTQGGKVRVRMRCRHPLYTRGEGKGEDEMPLPPLHKAVGMGRKSHHLSRSLLHDFAKFC